VPYVLVIVGFQLIKHVKAEQKSKALLSISVTLVGMVTFFNEEHPLKEIVPIDVILFGILIDFKLLHPSQVPLGMEVRLLGIMRDVSDPLP